MRANPGGYIPPHEVIGRDALIQQLWRILERQSLVLTAERRMGKTSILRKMEAESKEDQLPIFHDLENIRKPLEFVHAILNDVREHLSRSHRGFTGFKEFINRIGGAEIGGVIKLPDSRAPDWKMLLTETLENLVEHQERTLIFFWDEMPLMLENIKKSNGEDVAMEILDTLRSLRQTHPQLRMVYTGSIGLHHVITSLKRAGYANAPTNDMHTVDVPPLSDDDAQELARRLLRGERIQTDEPEQDAQTIAQAVDNCPYYIHHIVDALKFDNELSIDTIVDGRLTAPDDPWALGHYRERIDTYYEEDAQLVLNLLDILATVDTPLSFDDLFSQLQSNMETEDRETARSVLSLLQQDHYVSRRTDGAFQFRFPMIQRWWRLDRGLVS